MKNIALLAAVAVLAVTGSAFAQGVAAPYNNQNIGYNQTHPANPSASIPSDFVKQAPAGLLEVYTQNTSHGD